MRTAKIPGKGVISFITRRLVDLDAHPRNFPMPVMLVLLTSTLVLVPQQVPALQDGDYAYELIGDPRSCFFLKIIKFDICQA